MNVMQGDKFMNRQKGKKLLGNRQNVSKFGNRNSIGVVSSALASSKLSIKTPKYSFDGLVNVPESNNTRMGPPPAPSGASRKRPFSTSTTGHRVTNSTSSGNTRSASVLDISSNRDIWTPKYRNVSGNPRGLMSGSRSRTTPCSTTSNTTMPDSCIILAVSEGRGAARGEVGIAALDLKRPRLTLCQLSDRHSYLHSLTTMHFFHPVEIIVPHTFCDGIPTEIYRVIQNQFPNAILTAVQRRHFSEAKGLQKIQHLCAPEYNSVQLQLIHKFYALTAAAALLKYVEYIQCVVFQPYSLKIEYHASENSTFIDVETAVRLELVESLSGSVNRGCSLLSILNQTYTSGGLRSLRANILQPPCHLTTITTRLDCVHELLEDTEGLMPTLQSVMKQLYDVDKILWLCVDLPQQGGSRAGEVQLGHTMQLKTTMDLVPALVSALDRAKGQWFHTVKRDLENPKYTEISERIKRVIQDGVSGGRGAVAHYQRCFAVKPEINGLLDVARRSYSELVSDMEERVQQLSETYSLPLRMHTNASRGFHVVMVVGHKNKRTFNVTDLPSIFFEIQNHGSTVSMTTEEIVLMDQQARESLNEIQTMSNIVIFGLLTELRPYMSSLYKLCEHVAEIDVILSLAQVSTAGNYVRPTYSTYLELKNSIHPMLDYLIPVSSIPNDVFSSPEYNFHIITGPNMGGKTIYIKQIALLQIMAQIGCFVPASSAVFRIADRIFSRIGFNDSIECNSSTYVLEMKEIHYIMQTITPTSLVIVDELCRGTSSEEGTSMAWAICEYLLNTEAFVFLTTHFIFLTKLQELYFNVVNLHMKAEETWNNADSGGKKLVYQHKVAAGVTSIDHYGLTLAKNTNLPKSVISLAEDLAVIIASHKKALPTSELKNEDDILLYKLAAELKLECRKPETSEEKLNLLVETFKRAHPKMIQNIHSEIQSSNLNTNIISNNTKSSSSNGDINSEDKNPKPVITSRNNRLFSQEDPLGPMQDVIPSSKATNPTLMASRILAHMEDVQASVTVYRKKNNSTKNSDTTSPQKIIDEKNRANIVISDSDVLSDYNKTSFIHNSTQDLLQKSTRNEEHHQHTDVNQQSTSQDITRFFPTEKRQDAYCFEISETTSPQKIIDNNNTPNIVMRDSDELSFIHDPIKDNNTSRFLQKSTINTDHIDYNHPSTSKDFTRFIPPYKRQNNYNFQSATNYLETIRKSNSIGTNKSSSDEDEHNDMLQEYLTQRMTALFDGVESTDKKQLDDGHTGTSTKELKQILKSPTHSKESSKAIALSLTHCSDGNEDMSQQSNNSWNQNDSETDGSGIMATGSWDNTGDLSDLENFIQEVAMSQNSSTD